MYHFSHAQLFEITHAENIKSPLVQHSCRNAKVVEPLCHAGGRLSTRCRPQRRHAIPIEPAAPPGAPPTATSCLGASRTPAASARGESRHAGVRETYTLTDMSGSGLLERSSS